MHRFQRLVSEPQLVLLIETLVQYGNYVHDVAFLVEVVVYSHRVTLAIVDELLGHFYYWLSKIIIVFCVIYFDFYGIWNVIVCDGNCWNVGFLGF